jgi:ribosomal protein S18 acetylase RimI-like enzyme
MLRADAVGVEEVAVDVRPAVPSDVEAIAALVERAYAPWVERIGVRPLPMEDDYAGRVARGEAFVSGGERVEAVLVLVPQDGWLLVDNVAVLPELQGRGIGRRLLAFAEARARALRLRELRLYTNERMTENRALYARLGYEEIGRETIDGRHAVWMRRLLV